MPVIDCRRFRSEAFVGRFKPPPVVAVAAKVTGLVPANADKGRRETLLVRTDISRMLKQRGYEVTSEGTERDILLPYYSDEELVASFKVILYNLMGHDEIRKALRDWAYENDSPSKGNRHYIESYIDICMRFGKLGIDKPELKRNRYAHTFEWYISELLRREFAARASGFNLRLKDGNPDDEFDCIAVFDMGVVFVECKTGKGDIYPEIAKFIRRDAELDAAYSCFLFDRDYTFGRGDDLPELTSDQAKRLSISEIYQVSVGQHKFFEITGSPDSRGVSRFFFACPAFGGLEDRLRYMIRYCNEFSQSLLSHIYPEWCTRVLLFSATAPN